MKSDQRKKQDAQSDIIYYSKAQEGQLINFHSPEEECVCMDTHLCTATAANTTIMNANANNRLKD